jgi:aspartate aminotransferase
VLELRQSVARFQSRVFGLDYPVESVLVAGGARPLIYATYRALVDPARRSRIRCRRGTTTTIAT